MKNSEHQYLNRLFQLGFGKVVEILIQHGANAKLLNKDGKTPMDIAVERGS